MDCLQPPLEKEPPGQWHCPMCPPPDALPPNIDSILAQHDAVPPAGLHYPSGNSDADGRTTDPIRMDREDIHVGNLSSDETSDSDSDSDETVSAPVAPHLQSVKKKRPPKRTTDTQTPRPTKRMRTKVNSPAQPLIVRLRLPPKGKGKEREDDVEHNIFEDLLPPAERDMSKTNIDNLDRTRFEKSRLAAEVRTDRHIVRCCSLMLFPGETISGFGSTIIFGC